MAKRKYGERYGSQTPKRETLKNVTTEREAKSQRHSGPSKNRSDRVDPADDRKQKP